MQSLVSCVVKFKNSDLEICDNQNRPSLSRECDSAHHLHQFSWRKNKVKRKKEATEPNTELRDSCPF